MKNYVAFTLFGSCFLSACGGGSRITPPHKPGPATHFSVVAQASATAGVAFSFTVTALDGSNYVTTNYSGTVHFTSSDSQSLLPQDQTLLSGTQTLQATLKTAGNQTVTASDTVTQSITGTSQNISVMGATHFSITVPANATAGSGFNFILNALDAANNTVPAYAGTVHFTSSDSQADLPPTQPMTGAIATFAAALKSPGPQSISVTDTATAIVGKSSAIQVTAAAGANPVPSVNLPLSPDAISPGSAGFPLTVNGNGFVRGATVMWNGSARTTTFVSNSQLTANILASDVTTPNTAWVTVVNPGPGGGTSNLVFFAVTVPTASVAVTTSTFATGKGPAALVAADFNADGKLDLAVANTTDSTVSILLGNGDGTFRSHVDYPTSSNPTTIVTGDFNDDGKLDLIVGNSILLGNGDGTFQPFAEVPVAGTVAADFNGDGKLDLVALVVPTTPTQSNTISVTLGNGDGTFQAPVNSPAPAPMYTTGGADMCRGQLAAGDFNGDGNLDLAISCAYLTGQREGSLFVELGNGDGIFQPPSQVAGFPVLTSVPPDFNPNWVGLGDFNGDGKLDLTMTSCYSRDTLAASYPLFLGNGDGTFAAAVGGAPPSGNFSCPFSGAMGDFNGDGRLDLVATNPSDSGNPNPPGPNDDTVSISLGDGDGGLQTPLEFAVGPYPFSTVVGDFNGDGKLDLAVVNSTPDVHGPGNTVTVVLQK